MPNTRKLTVDERAEIGALALGTENISRLAHVKHVSRKTVTKWRDRARENPDDFRNAAGQGRKRKLSSSEEAQIRKMARAGRTCKDIAERRIRSATSQPVPLPFVVH